MITQSSRRMLHSLLPGGLLLAALGAPTAWAANLTVNSLADTATAGDTECTLREAINNANSNGDTSGGDCPAGSGADTSCFSVSGTITLGSTLPNITDAAGLTIDGGDAITVSGNNAVRVMTVNEFSFGEATLDLNNLTVANGSSFLGGGGILNRGTLTVSNSTFSGNSADAYQLRRRYRPQLPPRHPHRQQQHLLR